MRFGRRILLTTAAALLLFAVGAGAEEKEAVPLRILTEEAAAGSVADAEIRAEGAVAAAWTLRTGGETVFEAEEDAPLRISFRPRQEGAYTLEAEIRFEDGHTERAEASLAVRGTAAEPLGPETVFSQRDGWWKDKAYSKTDLDNAGCAIFTLSHALQRMGYTGEDVRPENLAKTFRNCYVKNGTAVARLINNASKEYGYETERNLIHDAARLREGLKNGDFYSFSIVTGHIALMTGIDGKANKVRVTDSAPSVTFERMKKGKAYALSEGQYIEVKDPGEIPGARFYPETGEYGGLEYYLDLEYCARRGGRMIRPVWLSWTGTAPHAAIRMVWPGAGNCVLSVDGAEVTVRTRELSWGVDGKPRLALVPGRKSIRLLDGEGKRIGSVPRRTVLPVLEENEDRLLVMYGEKRGWVLKKDTELLEPLEGEIPTGVLSVNGVASGRATVRMRLGPSEKESIAETWKTGTEISVVGREGDFLLAEARGMRLWVHRDFVSGLPEAEAAPEAGEDPAAESNPEVEASEGA